MEIIKPFKYVIWIDHNMLCFDYPRVKEIHGTYVSRSLSIPGSIWISNDLKVIHYVDALGYEREIEVDYLIELNVIDLDFYELIKKEG